MARYDLLNGGSETPMNYGNWVKPRALLNDTQPAGFWEKFKATNADGKVLGMEPDQFAMLMGNLASKIAPNTVAGGMGQAVNEYATGQFNQRMQEQNPEYRIAKMKADQIKAMTQGTPVPARVSEVPSTGTNLSLMPQGFGAMTSEVAPTPITPVQPTQPTQPMGFFEALGQAAEQSMAPTERAYKQAAIEHTQAATEGTRVGTIGQTLLNQKAQATMPAEIRSTEAQATSAESQARVATATEPQKIAAASAELDKLGAEVNLLNKEVANFEQTHIGIPQQQLGLGYARLKEDINMRRQTALLSLNQNLERQTVDVADHTNKSLSTALPKEQPGILANAGTTLISSGLKHFNSAKTLKDVDIGDTARANAAQAIGSGMMYHIRAINMGTSYEQKVRATMDMIDQIDQIRQYQPETAAAYEKELFGSGVTPIAGKTFESKWYNPFDKDTTFDPVSVYKVYRKQGRK